MKKEEFVVWEWVDEDGLPVYIGYGKTTYGSSSCPSKRCWMRRHKESSPLMDWLKTLSRPPKKSRGVTGAKLYSKEARAVAARRREQLKGWGFQILSDRPHDTRTGGGPPRAVKSPEGRIFPSVREAARAVGCEPYVITRLCQRGVWQYAEKPK